MTLLKVEVKNVVYNGSWVNKETTDSCKELQGKVGVF